MKKILLVLIILFFLFKKTNLSAQQVSLFAEVQTTQTGSELNFSAIPRNYYAEQWVSVIGKKGNGMYLQCSQEPEAQTLALGYITSKTFGKNWYVEGGIAPGLEWDEYEALAASASCYLYAENKTDDKRAKGKVTILLNPYYSKSAGVWWQGYAMYSVTKWLGVGGFFQTESAIGPRIQLNLPAGFAPWVAYGLQQKSDGNLITIGLMWNGSVTPD